MHAFAIYLSNLNVCKNCNEFAFCRKFSYYILHVLFAQSIEVAHMQRRERPDVTDVKFVIRKNRRQLNRVRYLLEMKAVITKATKVDAEAVAQNGA